MNTSFKNRVLLIVFTIILVTSLCSCNNDETSDIGDNDIYTTSISNEFEIKEGTYQKKNSEEKIVIVDQNHLLLENMDYEALAEKYRLSFENLDLPFPDDAAQQLKSERYFTTGKYSDGNKLSLRIFDDCDYNPLLGYYDDDGYSLVYLKEEYFLIDSEEE